MKTEKLFYHHGYQREFNGRVVNSLEKDGRCHVVLEKTLFYPTSGGQPHDTGTLNGIPVQDVYEDNGEIYHVLPQPINAKSVYGKIDWERRFDHMQQHSGQHLLSAVFETSYHISTVGFHLGSDAVTIDLACEQFSIDDAQKAEEEANALIYRDLPIHTYFVSDKELSALPLRKAPSVTENIRIVEIDQYDYSPCGGTHPSTTGQIGMIKIISWEKSRNHVRVTFLCGDRALKDYQWKNNILLRTAASLSIHPADLPTGLEKLMEQNRVYTKELKACKDALLSYQAKELQAKAAVIGSAHIIKAFLPEMGPNELRGLAAALSSSPHSIILLGGGKDSAALLFSRSSDLAVPMNQVLKEALPIIQGKGGGTSQTAQGGGPHLSSIEIALDKAFMLIQKELSR